jgi:PAS domain-containing protein
VAAVLNICVAEPGFFGDREIELLQEVALDISYALDKLEAEAQRKDSVQALGQSEEQFRVMFELASVGMAQADPYTGRFQRVNPKLGAITGYTADELLQMSFAEITHPEDRAHDWEVF